MSIIPRKAEKRSIVFNIYRRLWLLIKKNYLM
jgi:hypothetical protein